MAEPTATTARDVHDVVIVGSGPSGYTAAIYAARAGLAPIVFAGAVTAGGALMNTTEVENFPGFPTGVMGPDLMEHMAEQAERFGADIRYEDVASVELTGAVKTVTTDEDETVSARTVVLATGSAYRGARPARREASVRPRRLLVRDLRRLLLPGPGHHRRRRR